MKLPPEAIVKNVQLLVEGSVAESFLGAMANHLKLGNIQIQNFGGVSQLRSFLSAMVKMTGFPQINSIGIIRDADGPAKNAFDSVTGSLRQAGLPVPIKAGQPVGHNPAISVMILPNNSDSGMLETLICEAIRTDKVYTCIESFIECATRERGDEIPRLDKARVSAFLSIQNEPPLSLGVAVTRGYLNPNNLAFKRLCSFLEDIGKPNYNERGIPDRRG